VPGPRAVPSRRVLVSLWAGFAAINLALMFLLPGSETIPFHLVWFSLALVYGLAPWTVRMMVVALAIVSAATSAALLHHANAHYIGIQETTEVPLMAAIFLAMVWHVRRRQLALAHAERLAALDRQRAEAEQMFVRLMSHEMRTPITVARGYTELVRSAHPDPQTEEDTSIVLDELTKLDHCARRLVALITVDQPSELEEVDLDDLLDRVVHRWAPTAHRRWRVAADVGTLMTDGDRLQTALDCLLENAITYTGHGDSIEVVGRREPGHAVVEITDTGIGISPGDVPHVFDAFHRGVNSTPYPGTGLGLAIVRRTVEAWGGSVQATSTLGTRTTFTLRLPVPPGPPIQSSASRIAGGGVLEPFESTAAVGWRRRSRG
jgi:two-component system OmpR family sensor kinase